MTCGDCIGGVRLACGSNTLLSARQKDPNGDKLSYQWFATTGTIQGDETVGEGSYATWRTTDQPGNALIEVIVTDKDGNQTEGYLSVNISCCH